MSVRVFVAVSVVVTIFAGCLGTDAPPAAPGGSTGPLVTANVGYPVDAATWQWEGPRLSAPAPATADNRCRLVACPPPACDDTECFRVPFRLDLPADWWDGHDGALEVTVRWPTTFEEELRLWIEDDAGNLVSEGTHSGYAYSVALLAVLDEPQSGDYTAVVAAQASEGTHQGSIQVASWRPDPQPRPLLPDLITLPPTDLTFETPSWGAVGAFMLDPTGRLRTLGDLSGSRGCALEEVLDTQPQRCLRFTNAVGNIGTGPLEIRLSPQNGALAPTGTGFLQRIYHSDGTHEDLPGGATEFHAYHLHFHDAAANLYTVYTYDATADQRGDAIATGRKTGVCFADVGLIELDMPHTSPARYSGRGCLDPTQDQDWFMGLSPNWYDGYPWLLTDQFVDIADAPDGAYLLCSVTNQDGILQEADPDNNEGCTRFQLTGDTIEVLDPEPYHKAEAGRGP